MKRYSKHQLYKRASELNIKSDISLFFSQTLFHRFTCDLFCRVNEIEIEDSSAIYLIDKIISLLIKHKNKFLKSTKVLIHFNISESFPFEAMQKTMYSIHHHTNEDCNVMMSINYTNERFEKVVVLFG